MSVRGGQVPNPSSLSNSPSTSSASSPTSAEFARIDRSAVQDARAKHKLEQKLRVRRTNGAEPNEGLSTSSVAAEVRRLRLAERGLTVPADSVSTPSSPSVLPRPGKVVASGGSQPLISSALKPISKLARGHYSEPDLPARETRTTRGDNIPTSTLSQSSSLSSSPTSSDGEQQDNIVFSSELNRRTNNTITIGDRTLATLPPCNTLSTSSSLRPPPRARVGLNNLGNTCFMNSCLQCLSNTTPLAAHFLTTNPPTPTQRSSSKKTSSHGLAASFAALLRALWSQEGADMGCGESAVSPDAFLERVLRWAPAFGGYRQHDSQEFLRALLDGLHVECNRVQVAPAYRELAGCGSATAQAKEAWDYHRSRHDSPVQDIFCGQLQSTIRCLVCHKASHCFDPFLDLSLPIPKKAQGGSTSGSTLLTDCIDAFMAEEQLEGPNEYRCEHCKMSRPSTKTMSIVQFPPVLVLHIKRISGSGFSNFMKDCTPVRFPTEGLDMSNYISECAPKSCGAGGLVYDLYAVSNHTGSLRSGHYTAHCRNADDGKWYTYNDSTVTPVSPASIQSPAVYVLFYHRRGI